MRKQLSRCMAYVLAFLMALSTFTITPAFGVDSEDLAQVLDVNFEEAAAFDASNGAGTNAAGTSTRPNPQARNHGFFPSSWDRDSDSVMGDEYGDFAPLTAGVGAYSAPLFGTPGGVFGAGFSLGITPSQPAVAPIIRITFDGSVPRACDQYRQEALTGRGHDWADRSHLYFDPSGDLHQWQAWAPDCGCSWILRPGDTIPISGVGITSHGVYGQSIGSPGDHISPMSNFGPGRANAGPWNVTWSVSETDDDSGYMSPHNLSIPAANWSASGPPWPSHPRGANRPYTIRAAQGYYRANPIYTGMAIRARAFNMRGDGGITATHTYIVNAGMYSWDNMRIISIVMPPEHFAHPITGIYRNWDRGFAGRDFGAGVGQQGAAVGASAADHWVVRGWPTNAQAANGWGHMYPRQLNAPANQPAWGGVYTWPTFWAAPQRTRYPYSWMGQIRAGLWDGRDATGADVPGVAGYGLPVRRDSQGRAVISGMPGMGSATTSSQEIRHIANVEMFDGQGSTVINQLANTWVFGNWSRWFPVRSIRLNFNQGNRPCICCGEIRGLFPGNTRDVRGTNIVPDTRRYYYAPGEVVDVFRHLNIRVADPEGTDLRDPLSMWVAHPLRPLIQHATWGAIFVNGEFWGMQNIHTHRHAALISQMYGIADPNTIQLEGDNWVEEVGNLFITYPTRNVSADSRTQRPAVEGRSVDITAGTRRTAMGGTTADFHAGAHTGYARRVPAVFPATHPRAGQSTGDWAGASHLTREWFDYLDSVMDMDNFIDWFIVYYHLENWDSVTNNIEFWRTGVHRGVDMHGDDEWRAQPLVRPGMSGEDGRWRFIIQDFDNAIFHGTANMLEFFTAMSSPTCPGEGCAACGNPSPNDPRTNTACMGEPLGSAAPMDFLVDNSTWRRSEDAARIFRVLFQNPYFRATFAARYSTYTGTAFHPARMENLVRMSDNERYPVINRHLYRWGMMGFGFDGAANPDGWPNATWGPSLVPWMANVNGAMTPAQRAGNWRGTVTGDQSRWSPHTLAGPPEDNWDQIGWNAGSGIAQPPRPASGPPNAGWPQLRSQAAILALRAAPAGAGYQFSNPGRGGTFAMHTAPTSGAGNQQNAIEHMRAYFTRGAGTAGTNPRPGAARASYGRENLGLTGLGTMGQYARVNWQIVGGTGTTPANAMAGNIGWLNVSGAYIRPDLFTFAQDVSGQSFLGRTTGNAGLVSAFPAFNIGSFSARYLRNMPIRVTANERPGYIFTHFTVSAGATAHAGTDGIATTGAGARQLISGTPLTGNITHDTIWVTPGTAGTAVTVQAHFRARVGDELGLIVNQVYGQGSQGENAVSHGFIELYNPHNTPVILAGRSVQVQIAQDQSVSGSVSPAPWNVFEFPAGTPDLPASHSILIISRGASTWYNVNTNPALGHVPRYIITDYDFAWDLQFSNHNMSVAFVEGTAPLPMLGAADDSRVFDLVGAVNDPREHNVYNLEGGTPASSMRRSRSVRRVYETPNTFSTPGVPQDTERNDLDFMEIRYGTWNRGLIAHYRPRTRQDGVWPMTLAGTARTVSIESEAPGANVFPASARPTQIVGLQPGTPAAGRVFTGWTGPAGLVINNANCPVDAYFVMPSTGSGAITLTANFEEKPELPISVVINQVHGQGGPQRPVPGGLIGAENAVSHGFIELHNPTGNAVNIGNMTLQVMNDSDGTWNRLPLPDREIPPGGSFLVVSTDWYNRDGSNHVNNHVPALVIGVDEYDMGWNQRFSNNSMVVALVLSQLPLPSTLELDDWGIIVDLVGAVNSGEDVPHYFGEGPASTISRQRSVRRTIFAVPRNNETQFESIHFGNISAERREQVRPRWSGSARPAGVVTIINGEEFFSPALPTSFAPGSTVIVSAGHNPLREFASWTVLEGGVTLTAHPESPNGAVSTFTMPADTAVTLVANWGVMELIHTTQPLDIVFDAPPIVEVPIWRLVDVANIAALASTGSAQENAGRHSAPVTRSGTAVASLSSGVINVTGREAAHTGVFLWLQDLGVTLNQATNAYRVVIQGALLGTVESGTRFQIDGRNPTTGSNTTRTANIASGVPGAGGMFTVSYDFGNGVTWSHLRLCTSAGANNMRIDSIRIYRNPATAAGMMFNAANADSGLEIGLASRPSVLGAFDAFVETGNFVPFNNVFTLEALTGVANFINYPQPNNPHQGARNYVLPRVLNNGQPLVGMNAQWRLAPGSQLGYGSNAVTFPGGVNIRSGAAGTARVVADIFGPADARTITVLPAGMGHTANPGSANEGQIVSLSLGTAPAGQNFTHWSSSDVTIQHATDPQQAFFVMPAAPVTVTANFEGVTPAPATVTGLIINQIYGQGEDVDNHGATRSFIELYNPTSAPIPLANLSVQIQNGMGMPWQTLNLAGHGLTNIAPSHSLLIGANARSNSADAHVIPTPDITWTMDFSNRHLAVAVIYGQSALPVSGAANDVRLVDLVGAINDPTRTPVPDYIANYLGDQPAYRINRHRSVRRTNFEDTQDNYADFSTVNFETINAAQFQVVRPRNHGDGAWPGEQFDITVIGGSANPSRAEAGMSITLSPSNPPPGYEFSGWEAELPAAWAATNPISGANFTMPAHAVQVRAIFEPAAPLETLLINQVYGRAMDAGNAVSRGFIEIFNPTMNAVPLAGLSVQIQNQPNNPSGHNAENDTPVPWHVVPLAGILPGDSMPAGSSLLIVTQQENRTGARYIIENYDRAAPIVFSNRNFSVAIVSGTAPLPLTGANADSRTIDLVGVRNSDGNRDRVFNWRGEWFVGISNQVSARRIWSGGVPQDIQNNAIDFETVRFAADGINDDLLEELRPRYSGDGQWALTSEVTITNGTSSAVNNRAVVGSIVTVVANVPAGQRLTGWNVTPSTVTLARPDNWATTFVMPATDVTLTPVFAANQAGQNSLIAEFVYPNRENEPVSNQFSATTGIGTLTAWAGATQRAIGATPGQNRAPIVMEGRADAPNWAAVNHSTLAYNVASAGLASAFQIRFSTTGHENIRFSARQRSTGSGPDHFGLAYRIGATGAWVSIPNSVNAINLQSPQAFRSDTYADFDRIHAQTFGGFQLPAAVNNQPVVYLRVYMRDSSVGGRAGNTSINDILITGDADGDGINYEAVIRESLGVIDSPLLVIVGNRLQGIPPARGTPAVGALTTSDLLAHPLVAGIYNSNGTPRTAEFIGTGTEIVFTNGTRKVAIVYGDITGDGTVGAADLTMVRMHVANLLNGPVPPPLNPDQLIAANVMPVPGIGAADITAIRMFIAGIGPETLGPLPSQVVALATSEPKVLGAVYPANVPDTVYGRLVVTDVPDTNFVDVTFYIDVNPGIWSADFTMSSGSDSVLTASLADGGWAVGTLVGPPPRAFDTILVMAASMGLNNLPLTLSVNDMMNPPNYTGTIGTVRFIVPEGVDSVQFDILYGTVAGFFLNPIFAVNIPSYTWTRGGGDVAVESVTINPPSAILDVGATQQLTAVIDPDNATNQVVTWSSSDNEIATVSTAGLVTAVAAGAAIITVTTECGDHTATAEITVNAAGPIPHAITIVDGGTGANATVGGTAVTEATAGTVVTLNHGSNPGFEFVSWTVVQTPGTMEVMDVTSPGALEFDYEAMFEPFEVLAGDTFTMPNYPVTATASWQATTPGIVVTFDPTSGTFRNPADATLNTNSGVSVGQLPRMYRINNPGQRFMGWFNGDTRVLDNVTFTADVTLTARWRPTAELNAIRNHAFRIADVNDDSRVTSADATRIARLILQYGTHYLTADSAPQFFAADIDGDGRITPADITMLAQWLVGHPVAGYVAHEHQ